VLILGAYRQGQLLSVSVSYLVEDVVFVAVSFSHSDALHDYVSDRLLHVIRENAAANKNTKLIFATTAGLERGLQDYYLQRGAVVARRPALLKMNPITKILLKTFRKDDLEKIGANS